MFTGIVKAVGTIKQIEKPSTAGNDLTVTIASGKLDLSDVSLGDSIAVHGACLTVTNLHHDLFSVNISQETLNVCHGLDQLNNNVNLEKALQLSDRLGGHLVSGHIDCIGTVIEFRPIGGSHLLTIQVPEDTLKYIAPKGAITVNGVSLTINEVDYDRFSVNLIPHTLASTTLNELVAGAKVNLETDMLARYVARLMSASK